MGGSYFPVVYENHNFGTLRCRWVGAVHCIMSGSWDVQNVGDTVHDKAVNRVNEMLGCLGRFGSVTKYDTIYT